MVSVLPGLSWEGGWLVPRPDQTLSLLPGVALNSSLGRKSQKSSDCQSPHPRPAPGPRKLPWIVFRSLAPAHQPYVTHVLLVSFRFFLLQGGPVEILPFLYLGSAYHAARRDMLDALGITALLNVSSDCPNHFEGHYQYKCIPVEDNHKADISSWFMEAIEYIGRLPSNFRGNGGGTQGLPVGILGVRRRL